MGFSEIEQLFKEELVELCHIYAKNWLALDGVWFQSIEAKHGLAEALEHDANAWRRFTEIEARRIKQFLKLPERAGLEGLKKALSLRLYATLNKDEITMEGNTLLYKVIGCRVQQARNRKGMAYHPCKPVGILEYTNFAKVIDDRLQTQCISCHPDITDPSCNCIWQFTLVEKEE